MNNEVVRVLVTSPLGVGGVTNMMIHIQEHLDRSKINFDYLVFHDRHEPMEDKVLSLGSKKYVASADNVKFRPFRRIWRINEIRKVCKRNHIKILHYNADCAADMTNIAPLNVQLAPNLNGNIPAVGIIQQVLEGNHDAI